MLLLIAAAIVAFNFFPVTAVMIVFLAVLNDAAILSIAYDHVRGSDTPAARDMRTTLVIATALGVMGVIETFGLFALSGQVFGLSHAVIGTLIYLKLSVSGHLTIFVTRGIDSCSRHRAGHRDLEQHQAGRVVEHFRPALAPAPLAAAIAACPAR